MTLSWLVATLLVPPLLLVGLAGFVWRRRSQNGGVELVGLLLAVALWGATSALEKLVSDLDTKLWIATLQYVGIAAVPLGCVAVASAARGVAPERLMRWLLWLAAPGLLTLGAILTNPWHLAFWSRAIVDDSSGIPILRLGYGPLFWLHIAWSYALFAGAVGSMIAKWAGAWERYRSEACWVLVGISAPLAANVAYLFRAGSLGYLDLTPAAFSVTAVCLAWPLVLRDDLFDVVLLARRDILDHIADGVLVVDCRERLLYANDAARRVLQLAVSRLPAPAREVLSAHPQLIESNAARREIEIEHAGGVRIYDLDVSELAEARAGPATRVLVLRDITAARHATERVFASERALRQVIDLVPHLIYAKDEAGRVLLVNQATAKALGAKPEAMVGRELTDFGVLPEDAERIRAADREVSRRGERICVEESVKARDGTPRVFQSTKIPFVYPLTGDRALLGISIDVTEKLRDEERIRRLAFFDSLTGLPNRRRFLERLSRAIKTARYQRTRVCVLFVDLDDFKQVNDRFGHAAGDELLCEVSRRLCESVRFSDHLAFTDTVEADPVDSVSRLAGDEFTILLTNVGQATDGARVAERISEEISRAFRVGDEEVSIGVSIGMASYPDDGEEVERLMHCADQAMYEAKRTGHDFAFFDPACNAAVRRRRRIEAALPGIVERAELGLRFRAFRDLRTGELCGAEALPYWDHPDLGELGPEDFFELAEKCGRLVEIASWTLGAIGGSIRRWRDAGRRVPRVAVDVAPALLEDASCIGRFTEALQPSGIELGAIDLRVSERRLVDAAGATTPALRDAGARLTLAGFGGPSSSTHSLARIPFDRLELDAGLVAGLPDDEHSARLVSGIAAMAHQIGMRIAAVGVGREDQLECLREMGCDELQGPLIGEALPADGFERLLAPDKPED